VESQESESKWENCDENSSRRILRQNGIKMHQSACRDLDQLQRSSSSSKHAATSSYDVIASQLVIASPPLAQPTRYKRGRRGRTSYIAISDPEADTSERRLESSTDTNSTTSLLGSTDTNPLATNQLGSTDTNPRSTLGLAMARTKQSARKTDEDLPPRATYP